MRALLVIVSLLIFTACAAKVETGYLTDTDPNYLVKDTMLLINQQYKPASTDFQMYEPSDEYGKLLTNLLRENGYGMEVLSLDKPSKEQNKEPNTIIYMIDQTPANEELATPEMYRIKLMIGAYQYSRAYKRNATTGLLMPITNWSRRW